MKLVNKLKFAVAGVALAASALLGADNNHHTMDALEINPDEAWRDSVMAVFDNPETSTAGQFKAAVAMLNKNMEQTEAEQSIDNPTPEADTVFECTKVRTKFDSKPILKRTVNNNFDGFFAQLEDSTYTAVSNEEYMDQFALAAELYDMDQYAIEFNKRKAAEEAKKLAVVKKPVIAKPVAAKLATPIIIAKAPERDDLKRIVDDFMLRSASPKTPDPLTRKPIKGEGSTTRTILEALGFLVLAGGGAAAVKNAVKES